MKRIVEALNAYRYRFRSREELRAAVAHVFERHGILAVRGVDAGLRHADFVADGWSVVVATDGGLTDVTRALRRVTAGTKGVILVTPMLLHTRMPPVVWGRPLVEVNVGAPLGSRVPLREEPPCPETAA